MIDDDQAAPPCAATGCTRPAAPVLCETDTRRLGDWLAQLGAEYELLSAAPSMQGREPGTGGGGGLASQRSPAALPVLVLRDRRSTERSIYDPDSNAGRSAFEILHAHAEAVREARGLAYPTRALAGVRAGDLPGPVCAGCGHESCARRRPGPAVTVPAVLTVASERKLLSDQLDWILTQDFAGEFFDEIRALWGLLRAANGHSSGARRVRCREDGCTGTVRWVDGAAVCGACGATTRGPELLRVAAEREAA